MNIDEIRADIFWSRVAKSTPDRCWPWTRGGVPYGYGAFMVGTRANGGRNYGAHVIAWILSNHAIPPKGMNICHTCDNPPCCNPAHLFLGTVRDNWADSLAKNRRPLMPLKPASEHAETMPRGSAHWKSTLSEEQVRGVRQLLASGMRQCDVMRATGLDRRTIQRLAQCHKTWAHIQAV